jgi:hypothetical protein
MQLLMAIGVALNIVQADPISHNNMVHLPVICQSFRLK